MKNFFTACRAVAIACCVAGVYAGEAVAQAPDLQAPSLKAPVDENQAITQLIREHRLDEALTRVDAALAVKPRDVQLRFLKGVVLTEQNKTAEAIEIYIQMTEDFPELPEPHNNLAVIYAAQGRFDKARDALDASIRVAPSYALAHENLGDIYIKLASQSYEKAVRLAPAQTSAAAKLKATQSLSTMLNNKPAKP